MKKIDVLCHELGLSDDEFICYGNDKAKILREPNDKKQGKLILVTAVNPTPYGEGKTTVTIGLNDAFCSLGLSSMAVLREPSLGPVFGMKGGATGGGRASVIPEDDINLHFTGDFHAITSANNLLCAAIDNHIFQGNALGLDPDTVAVKRCMDMNDRALRSNFNITAASEVMAIFCLSTDFEDLKNRLGNILIGYTTNKKPLYAKDLKVEGAMALLLKDAFHPNLVQSLEENPVLIHGGPFANIAHGCNSIVATKTALGLSDYVVTEAGFGSDLGAEKFLNIKCPLAGISPSFIVLVATVRALKHSGMENLLAHIDHLRHYHIPFCVAINHFSDDPTQDIEELQSYCTAHGVESFVTNSFLEGGAGSTNLAQYIIENVDNSKYQTLYASDISVTDKIETIAREVYAASSV
ncbi:MAG: formate--tetrahydrofolate ligase, partial [Bacilli bacterium]|nr:formate--tetrahydrofolate ligase [Bacilli bacterium]